MDQISWVDFAKVDFRVGEIIEANKVEGSEKMIKMNVDFGQMGIKTVFSGILKWYQPEELVGKKTVFVVNIEPKKVMGELSEAMIFAASAEATDGQGAPVVLIIPDKEINNGAKVF